MKRYIYAMSTTRSFILGKMDGYAEVIQEHILKCVTSEYTNNCVYIDKWIGDIAKAIFNISRYAVGTNNKRLPEEEYRNGLFDSVFGDAKLDMQYHLEDFQEDYPEYADFVITDEMATKLFHIISEMRDAVPKWISENKEPRGLSISHTKAELKRIFAKYISFKSGRENWYK